MDKNLKEIASGDLHNVKTLQNGEASQIDLCLWKREENSLIVVRKSLLQGDFLRFKHHLTSEISILLNIKHENIVAGLGYVHTPAEFSLVLEYCKYESYHKHFIETNYARRRCEIDVLRLLPLKLRILKEIACGMEFLHSKPCLHLNLKAENVLLDGNFRAKLSSFGKSDMKTVVTLSRSSIRNRNRNETSSLLYTAPEHLANSAGRATTKSDVYAFAILNWQILCDSRPYQVNLLQTSIASLLDEIRTKNKRPRLEDVLECFPGKLSEIISRSWDVDPASRPDFREISDGLSALIASQKEFEDGVDRSIVAAKALTEAPTWEDLRAMIPQEVGVFQIRYGNFNIAIATTLGIKSGFPVYACEAVDVLTGNMSKQKGMGSAFTVCKLAVWDLIKDMVAKRIYPKPSDLDEMDKIQGH